MKFSEIRKELGAIVFEKLRVDSENYFEAVIAKSELTKLTVILEKFLGAIRWPSESPLSLQIQEAINAFGGVKEGYGQSLYFCNQESETVFAMLWPWEDGWHTTVKVIQT